MVAARSQAEDLANVKHRQALKAHLRASPAPAAPLQLRLAPPPRTARWPPAPLTAPPRALRPGTDSTIIHLLLVATGKLGGAAADEADQGLCVRMLLPLTRVRLVARCGRPLPPPSLLAVLHLT